MNKRLLASLAAVWGAFAGAAEPAGPVSSIFPLVQAETFILGADRAFADELWLVARNIRIDGHARNDVFLLAGASRLGLTATNSGAIALNGRIGGDCWAAGLKVELDGEVEQHARVAAQMTRINGRVGGNLMAAATTVSLDTNALVGGSARILADYFILRGTVDGNLLVSARKVVLDGVVNGTADIRAETVSILSKARIRGPLVCETANPVRPDGEAVLGGSLVTRAPPEKTGLTLVGTLLSFIGALLSGMFILLFAPRLIARATGWMEAAPWRTLASGLGIFLLIPLVVLFAFASILGIPLSLVTAGLYGLGVYLGRFVAALSVARLVTGARRRQPLPIPSAHLMLLGLILFYLSSFLPVFLADAIWFWFTVCGLGGLFLAIRGAPPLSFRLPPPPAPDANPPPPPP